MVLGDDAAPLDAGDDADAELEQPRDRTACAARTAAEPQQRPARLRQCIGQAVSAERTRNAALDTACSMLSWSGASWM